MHKEVIMFSANNTISYVKIQFIFYVCLIRNYLQHHIFFLSSIRMEYIFNYKGFIF
jgi:hypothetical protein